MNQRREEMGEIRRVDARMADARRETPSDPLRAIEDASSVAPDSLRRVLVVDDEETIRLALSRFLRLRGYEVEVAGSGAAALDALSQGKFALMVCDLRMPGMTGVELLRRAKAICPETIRLVLSSYAELQPVTDAINDGTVYRFLTKPWDDEQLRSFINEAFHHKELADENRQLNLKILTADQQLATCRRQLQELLGPVPAQEVAV